MSTLVAIAYPPAAPPLSGEQEARLDAAPAGA